MYDKHLAPMPAAQKQSEHEAVAIDFANTMLERFSPEQCHEIILTIRQIWAENWQIRGEEAQKTAENYSAALAAIHSLDSARINE